MYWESRSTVNPRGVDQNRSAILPTEEELAAEIEREKELIRLQLNKDKC